MAERPSGAPGGAPPCRKTTTTTTTTTRGSCIVECLTPMTQPLDLQSLLRDAQQHIQGFKGGGEAPSATLTARHDDDGATLDASFQAVVERLTEAERGCPESKPIASSEELDRQVSMKVAGLHLLYHLERLQTPGSKALASLIACLASFTNLQDLWTSPEAYDLAQSLLSQHLQVIQKDPKNYEALLKDLLLDHVKPLFIKSKNPILTDQARKAISPLPGPNASSDFDSSNKPWKFQSPHIVTTFQWILSQLDAPLLEAQWPLIIPPLLTILDDVSIKYKVKGCELLVLLLKVAPANLLERSGLGEIFHNTLMPYLLYLPSLTPEEDSIPLLDAAYTALIALTSARYSTSGASKTKSLDSIFRYGILKGHAHAGENVRIASLLLKKSTDLVNAMGIYCVKHLKDLLPLISATLTAPFATAYPPLLDAALQTLRAIITNGWPRVGFHRGEILEGLIICWWRIEDEGKPTPELVGIKDGIEDISRAVVRLLRDDEHAMEEIQTIGNHDLRLMTLLEI
ncbi:MAG: hypothetical protein Q9188_004634 [Gyalolechia gomerana]